MFLCGLDNSHQLFSQIELFERVEKEILRIISQPGLFDSRLSRLISLFGTISNELLHLLSDRWVRIMKRTLDATLLHNGIYVIPVLMQTAKFSDIAKWVNEDDLTQIYQYISYLREIETSLSDDVVLVALSSIIVNIKCLNNVNLDFTSGAFLRIINDSKNKQFIDMAIKYSNSFHNIGVYSSFLIID
jgi:hypothetical protein